MPSDGLYFEIFDTAGKAFVGCMLLSLVVFVVQCLVWLACDRVQGDAADWHPGDEIADGITDGCEWTDQTL